MQQIVKVIFLACAVFYLAACAVRPQPQVEQAVSENPAVVALVDSARAAADTGRFDSASATLERALRIEARNPKLWHELALIRMQQGHHQQAASLAAKSNAWAGNDTRLRSRNWRVIGEARARVGDWEAAQKAFNKAENLQ